MLRKLGAGLGLAGAATAFSTVAMCAPRSAPPEDEKKDRGVAVVTGGSRGIGAATCVVLAEQGYRVAVNYCRDAAAAERVVSQIRAAGGVADAFQADVSDSKQAAALFAEAERKLGTPLVALVNNAGILGSPSRDRPLEELTEEELMRVFRTNVVGALHCCREAAARMAAGGAIVNVSSGAAYIGTNNIAYSVSKGALNSMQCSLVAPLMKRGIRINTVSPGICDTDMVSHLSAGFKRTQGDTIPAGRMGRPTEIAWAVAYLLDTEKAAYTAGANIRVAGGRQTGFGM